MLRAAGSQVGDTRLDRRALAAVLLLAAGGLVLVGLESRSRRPAHARAPVRCPTTTRWVVASTPRSMAGCSARTSRPTLDTDGDGIQDEDETGEDWAYWMVDPDDAARG